MIRVIDQMFLVMQCFELRAVQDVVDAQKGEVAGVGGSQPGARFQKCIVEVFGDGAIDERGGRIVEVATNDNRVGRLADVLPHHRRLTCAPQKGFVQFVKNDPGTRRMTRNCRIDDLRNEFVVGLRKTHRLEMKIKDANGVCASHHIGKNP